MAAKKMSSLRRRGQQICIITITGKDRVGIIAKIANAMAKANINIIDVNQKIMENYFVMTMAVDIAKATVSIPQIHKKLDKIGEEMKLRIIFQDENIFKMMHRV